MTGQADHIEVPLPMIGPRAVLRAERSQYGDYFDFEVRNGPAEGVAQDVAALIGASAIASIAGYACRARIVAVEFGTLDDGSTLGGALLVVGNTTVLLPLEHGPDLAMFLGIELERK